jgi:hypothetical protein
MTIRVLHQREQQSVFETPIIKPKGKDCIAMNTKQEKELLMELGFLMKLAEYAKQKHKKPRVMRDLKTYKMLMYSAENMISECCALLLDATETKNGAFTKYSYTQKEKKDLMNRAKSKGYTK